MSQYTFYFDQSRCTGCSTCIIACKDWNNVKAGNLSYRTINTIEQGDEYPNIKVANTVFSCNHCAKPACVPICPVQALSKNSKTGIVTVDRDMCIACGSCLDACPFGAPHYGDSNTEPVSKDTWQDPHPMQKCDFCASRLAEGKQPICVGACLVRALDAGTEKYIKNKYPDSVASVEGFPSDKYESDGKTKLDEPTQPSIRFKRWL